MLRRQDAGRIVAAVSTSPSASEREVMLPYASYVKTLTSSRGLTASARTPQEGGVGDRAGEDRVGRGMRVNGLVRRSRKRRARLIDGRESADVRAVDVRAFEGRDAGAPNFASAVRASS